MSPMEHRATSQHILSWCCFIVGFLWDGVTIPMLNPPSIGYGTNYAEV